MDGALVSEYNKLVEELSQGMEKAKQLHQHLSSTYPSEAQEFLLQRIISSFDKALVILNWSEPAGKAHVGASASVAVDSSVSVNESSRSYYCSKSIRDGDASKKRKLQPTRTEQVRVNSESGLEGPAEDGYSWRKYGQKDILGARYPRSYYRCTYRSRNCWATKQVQRSDDDPTLFEVTYKGSHTCSYSGNSVPPPASPQKTEMKKPNSHYYRQDKENHALLNLKANLRVNTEHLNIKEMPDHFSFPSPFECHDRDNQYSPISALVDDNGMASYSTLFNSPDTTGANYFSESTYQMRSYGNVLSHSANQIPHIVSSQASKTNSPSEGMEFSVNEVADLDLDPNFLFGIPEFSHDFEL